MFVLALLLAQFSGGFGNAYRGPQLSASQWAAPVAHPAVVPSSGCGTTAPVTGTTTRSTTLSGGALKDVDNNARTYVLQVGTSVPGGSPDSTPHVLVFVFAGANQTSADAQGFGVCAPAAAVAGAICVYIQGIPFQGSSGSAWDDSGGNPSRSNYWQQFGAADGRDSLFWDSVSADVEAHYCIDTNRVFLAGFSWGCDLVTSMSSTRGNQVRAVAGASCAYAFWTASDPTTYGDICSGSSSPCNAAQNVGHLAPSLTAPLYRFTGDIAGDVFYSATLMRSTVDMVRAHNGCSLATASIGSPCSEYQWCSARVIECRYAGLGHAIPPNWGTDTWNVFAAI